MPPSIVDKQVPMHSTPSQPGLGVCILVFDRDVQEGDMLEELVRAPSCWGRSTPTTNW